jgi:hypothetical protein
MTTKMMSPKRFVSAKFSGKVSAEGFLSAHWEFLKGQEYLNPILESYEKKELLPTPTIQLCQQAVLDHILATQGQPKVKVVKQEGMKVIRRKKNDSNEVDDTELHSDKYTVTLMCKVYDRAGTCTIQVGTVERKREVEVTLNGVTVTRTVTEVEPAVWEVSSFNAAMRMADRRLTDRGDSVFATINNNVGKPITTVVQRDDAIARMLKAPKGPATRNTHSGGGSQLGFGIRAKNDTCHFSRG